MISLLSTDGHAVLQLSTLAGVNIANVFSFCSECGGGPSGILADEAVPWGWLEEWGPGGLWDGSFQQPSLCLLRHPAGRELLWKLPGKSCQCSVYKEEPFRRPHEFSLSFWREISLCNHMFGDLSQFQENPSGKFLSLFWPLEDPQHHAAFFEPAKLQTHFEFEELWIYLGQCITLPAPSSCSALSFMAFQLSTISS